MTLPHPSIDQLYRWLGYFTGLFLILVALEFFFSIHLTHPFLGRFLDALSEPYLGALAVYVVLKEVRKHHMQDMRSRHRGERFVWAWLLLLGSTTLLVALTGRYHFDGAYQLVISNSLASLMIYVGSRIHHS